MHERAQPGPEGIILRYEWASSRPERVCQNLRLEGPWPFEGPLYVSEGSFRLEGSSSVGRY